MKLLSRSLAVWILNAIFLSAVPSLRAQDKLWPSLSSAAIVSGGGDKDAAVIVGIENYFFVDKIAGARLNAGDWQAHFIDALGVPAERVTLLRDDDATLERMRQYAAEAALKVEPGGTLWFIFIGHGTPSKDGKDGVLVGVDAQQRADSLYERSLPRAELLDLLAKGRQAKTVILLDACFSGKSPSGRALVKGLQPLLLAGNRPADEDPRTVLLTAAKSDQFAGSLPKADRMRPAFSYLALGALRGWASDASGTVTAGALVSFAEKALRLAKDRRQTPELAAGLASAVLAHAREPGPDLKAIDRQESATARPQARRGRMGKAGIEWLLIPGGSFLMGSEDIRDAKPRRRVAVKSFEMAKTEVTFKQYRACVEAGACTRQRDSTPKEDLSRDDHPVIFVDWAQAKAFSQWVGGRLPSEAEWEFAARSAGKDRAYPWGDEAATCERAVLNEGSDSCGQKYGMSWPVCSRPAGNTDQSLCDMAGNVWEWVEDWYHPDYQEAPESGDAWLDPAGSGRVARGGSWQNRPLHARSARRHHSDPADQSEPDLGFRPVISLH